jgi:ATP synthase subunit 6
MLYSPLDQFQIFELSTFFPFSNYFIYGLLYLLLPIFLLILPSVRGHLFGSLYTFAGWEAAQGYLSYVLSVVSQLGYYYLFYLVILATLLFVSNLFGLFPYGFTVTSHISFTFASAFMILIAINVVAFFRFLKGYWALFLPSGTPFMIAPLLVVIELVSYLSRLFSLSIRLFANIMAGHTLVHILLSFIFKVMIWGGFFLLISILPMILSQLIFFMETGIAILQSYVFVALVLNYINDLLSEGH